MPPISIFPIMAAVAALILIVLILLRRRRRKAKSQIAPSTSPSDGQTTARQVTETPPSPPKFITDPPEAVAVKKAPVELLPLPVEEPLITESSEKKIRILVVDDNRDTADNVSRLLYFEDDMEVIGQAYNGREGVKAAVAQKPHIVLMDINMPDMDGITATQHMSHQIPYAQVIIMSVQAEPEYMRKAMSAGARDYQTKPFSADELVNCIRRVYRIGLPAYQEQEAAENTRLQLTERPSKKEETPIQNAPAIALYSPKGGTGVSAMASNLAVALQQDIGNVALIDADLQFGDLMVHLNTKADRGIGDLADISNLDADLISQVLLPHQSGLKLLLAPQSPEMAELITPENLTQIINLLKDEHRAVVIDTTSMLSNQTLSVLDAADYILLVIVPELPAIKSAKLFLELIKKLEYSPERVGIVLNRANIAGAIPIEQIRKVLRLQKMYYVPNDIKLHAATNRGQSICEQEADAPSARAITALAKTVWEDIANSR